MQQADQSWREATFCMTSMVSWLWSVAMLVVEYTGAISCWAGSDFVVLGLRDHAQLPQLLVQVGHELGNMRLMAPK